MKLTKFALSMIGVLAAVTTVYVSQLSATVKIIFFVFFFALFVYLAIRHRPSFEGDDLAHPRDGRDGF